MTTDTRESAYEPHRRGSSVSRVPRLQGRPEVDVDDCVRQIAMGLHPRLAELTADLLRRLEVELPALGPETRTGDMFEAGIAGNLETLLHALRYGIDIDQVQSRRRRPWSTRAGSRKRVCRCTRSCVPTGSASGG